MSKKLYTKKTKRGKVVFSRDSNIAYKRGLKLLSKEPQTIEWIDSFVGGSGFWDIGANTGSYSLYAALDKTIKVLAFEPFSPSYYSLNKNIKLNKGMEKLISAYCVALGDSTCLGTFYTKNMEIGKAGHSFGKAVDCFGKKFKPFFKHGAMCFSVDNFIKIFDASFPNYIKIDVDGIEEKVVAGAMETLKDERFRSILVELDEANQGELKYVLGMLETAGLKFIKKHKAAPKCSIYNYIYGR